jgi:hypothetical protein
MSPSESADDAVNPLKLSLGKLTGAMAFGRSHLRASGRVPHSAQNKGLRRRPPSQRRAEGYGFARGEKAVRSTRGLLRMRRRPACSTVSEMRGDWSLSGAAQKFLGSTESHKSYLRGRKWAENRVANWKNPRGLQKFPLCLLVCAMPLLSGACARTRTSMI